MRALLLGAVLGVAASCSCGGGVELDDYPATAARAYCSKIYACCTITEVKARQEMLGPNQEACETTLKAQLGFSRDSITASEGKHRVVYHADRVSECLAALPTSDCTALKSNATDVRPTCTTYLEPKVAAGGGCTQDFECIAGGCIGSTNGTDGACVAFVAEGEACAYVPCGSGLFCTGNPQTCQRLRADGAQCSTNGECAPGGCNGRNPDAGTPGVCGLKGGEGTTCFVTSGCSAAAGAPLIALLALMLRRSRHPERSRRKARGSAPPP